LRDWRLAQVRIRSPSPDSPVSVSGPGSHGAAEAGKFGKGARGQRRPGAVAEAAALGDAAGNGEHVLDRAADLHADDIVGGVDAEGRQTQGFRQPPAA
jgi:hypothetical protein